MHINGGYKSKPPKTFCWFTKVFDKRFFSDCLFMYLQNFFLQCAHAGDIVVTLRHVGRRRAASPRALSAGRWICLPRRSSRGGDFLYALTLNFQRNEFGANVNDRGSGSGSGS